MDPTHDVPQNEINPVTSAAPVEPPPVAPAAPKPRAANPPPAPQRMSARDILHSMTDQPDNAIDRAVDEAMQDFSQKDAPVAVESVAKSDDPDEGAILTGRIANIGSEDVLIDFGGKDLGTMTKNDFAKEENFKVGDAIEVAVVGHDARSGLLAVSRRKARQIAILREMTPGKVLEGVVTGMNKGGLEVTIEGLRGFIPASQVDLHFMKDISELIGKTIRAEVTKRDPGEDNIILSRRKVLQRESEENKDKLFDALQLGEVRRGKVRGLAEYGAFVDLGGVDGLLHVSDMSWGRVNKPEEVVKVGDEIEVKIIKLSKEKKKVSLSLKQTMANPWELVSSKYAVGSKVNGKVVRMQNFGAFVELEPGVDGLLPVSEMSWTKRVRSPSEILKEGDAVEVSVIALDAENRKLTLSLKAVSPDPWTLAAEKFERGTTITGKVVRTTEFGAFVELGDGIDGLIHISELDEGRVRAVTDKVKVGQEVSVRVLGVDPTNKRVSLSMKKPPPEPTPEELAERAAAKAAAEKAASKRREKHESRRGGITISWDQGLGSLDPSKFAR